HQFRDHLCRRFRRQAAPPYRGTWRIGPGSAESWVPPLVVLRHNVLLISPTARLAASTGGTAVNDQPRRLTHGDVGDAGSSTLPPASLITGLRPPSPRRPETR